MKDKSAKSSTLPTPPKPPGPNAATEFPCLLLNETTLEDIRLVSVSRTGLTADLLAFRQAILQDCVFAGCEFPKLRLFDVSMKNTDLANMNCEQSGGSRVVLEECRLMGINLSGSDWDDLSISHCHAPYARFPVSRFRRTVFDACNLENADFFGSDLTKVLFRDCNLKGCRFLECQCRETDFRGSELEGVLIGTQELQGAIVEPMQAPILIARFGVTVKWPQD